MTTIKIAACVAAFIFTIAGADARPRTPDLTFDNDGRQIATPNGAPRLAQNAKRRARHVTARGTTVPAIGFAVITSGKTGATASVSIAYRATFQAYVDAVEAAGARVMFMGGRSPTRTFCSRPRHKHGCGEALDVCQTSRGVVDHRCRLPGRLELASIARRVGLQEGGEWCHGDYGHAEAGGGAPPCAKTGPRVVLVRP